MLEVKEVKTRKEQKLFINFPLRMYHKCPYFVPPLYGDEKAMFNNNYHYLDTCETKCFLAYLDGKVVGRIQAILQKASNEKWQQKRVRFTRFDSIDDVIVSKALFQAVEEYAKEKHMEEVVGPLGFSDLEREGLLIEGFNELSTFEEQYNYEYYPHLLEEAGYAKEVDWTERKIIKGLDDERLSRMADVLMRRNNLHLGEAKNTRDFLKKYADDFFAILDITYANIYGTVPFTEGMKKSILANFKMVIDVKHVAVVLNADNQVIAFGICLPSVAKAVQKSKGHLTIPCLFRLIKAIKRPRIIDLALIGVLPEYQNKGVTAVIISSISKMLETEIDYAETNLNLEDNYQIQNTWKSFENILHKRRRSYIKKLC